MIHESVRIHPTADVHEDANIGAHSAIWHFVQVRGGATIGEHTNIGQGSYIGPETVIGSNAKIQNYAFICDGITIEDGVCIGPHVSFTNDFYPRAVNPDGSLKGADDWEMSKTLIKAGASLGANSTIICGITIGAWALVGAGSVVTRDVPDHGLVVGNPARLRGFVGASGERGQVQAVESEWVTLLCPRRQEIFRIPRATYDLLPPELREQS